MGLEDVAIGAEAQAGARLNDMYFVEGPIFSIICDQENGIFVVGSGGGGARVGVRNYVTAYSLKKGSDGFFDFNPICRQELEGIPEVIRHHQKSNLWIVGARDHCHILKLAGESFSEVCNFKADKYVQGLGVCGDANNLSIVTAGEEGVVRVWQYQVGAPSPTMAQEIKPPGPDGSKAIELTDCDISLDGKYVAATFAAGVALWNAADGASIGVVDYTSQLTGEGGKVKGACVRFINKETPGGTCTRLAVAVNRARGASGCFIHNMIMPGEEIKFDPKPLTASRIDTSSSIFRMNFRPDSESVVFGMGDSSVKIYGVARLRELEPISREMAPNRSMPCKGCDIFNDGNVVISGTADGVIHVACGRRKPWCKLGCGSCFSFTCFMFFIMFMVFLTFSALMFVGGGPWVQGWHVQHVAPRFAAAETHVKALNIDGMLDAIKETPVGDIFQSMDQRRNEPPPSSPEPKKHDPNRAEADAPLPREKDSEIEKFDQIAADLKRKEELEAAFDATASLRDEIATNTMLLVSTQWNQNCLAIKQMLSEELEVKFNLLELEDVNRKSLVQGTPEKWDAALMAITGSKDVPKLFINGELIGGFDEIMNQFESDALEVKLIDAGLLAAPEMPREDLTEDLHLDPGFDADQETVRAEADGEDFGNAAFADGSEDLYGAYGDAEAQFPDASAMDDMMHSSEADENEDIYDPSQIHEDIAAEDPTYQEASITGTPPGQPPAADTINQQQQPPPTQAEQPPQGQPSSQQPPANQGQPDQQPPGQVPGQQPPAGQATNQQPPPGAQPNQGQAGVPNQQPPSGQPGQMPGQHGQPNQAPPQGQAPGQIPGQPTPGQVPGRAPPGQQQPPVGQQPPQGNPAQQQQQQQQQQPPPVNQPPQGSPQQGRGPPNQNQQRPPNNQQEQPPRGSPMQRGRAPNRNQAQTSGAKRGLGGRGRGLGGRAPGRGHQEL